MGLDPEYAQEYCAFMSEYEALGHMRPVPTGSFPPEDTRVSYLPHHAIWQVSDKGKKLRVVFNASCRAGQGPSLNECLLSGPALQSDLVVIICRWRLFRIAAGADIEKMYRQILVDPQDIDLQRIVWQGQDGSERHFQLLTVTYGLNCAPFLALRVLKQLAHDEAWRFPRAAKIISDSSYVDDVLYGADDVSTARQLRDELIGLTTAGGFRLRKWTSSNPRVLNDLPEDDRLRPQWRDFSMDNPVKTLGIAWDPSSDELRYKIPQPTNPARMTKRAALSVIARFFDPLGWVSPVIINAKILLQDMWRDKLDWDEELSFTLGNRWRNFIRDLPLVSEIRIPRWLGASSSSVLQLHGFADASKLAYAAVVYLTSTNGAEQHSARLLASKTRVAPVKTQTIPRLELCAAALLAELLHKLRTGLGEQVSAVHAWSDSTIALAWIEAEPSRWEVFVANRVSRIQQLLPGTIWRHIPSEDNPADLASRGVSATELAASALWWEGPSWLALSPSAWPAQSASPVPVCNITLGARQGCPTDPPTKVADFTERFSSLERLLRTIARCLRLPSIIRPEGRVSLSRPIAVTELNNAFHACVRHIQNINFQREITTLRHGHTLPRRNRLSSLFPFLDAEGTLRVGGRLQHARLPYEQRHPVILPRKSHLGHLIIDRAHKMALHGGHALTYSYAMRSAWIIGGRGQTRAYVRKCVTCVRARARPASQLMGNLPAARVEPARPFSRTGLDYAGPFSVRASAGRGVRSTKGYLAVFVCLCTKAVHLELVGDLTTASFIAALHRFAARKTSPREIWSDNATTFHGADAELRAMLREARIDWDRVSDDLASSGITWKFIPPSAPHFGGLWEAAVKSAKSHLRKIVGQRPLTYEMYTLISKIESCLNSRPLTALSGDIDDLQALTPWHLVTGYAPDTLPRPEIGPTENLEHISHWRLVRSLHDQFWMQWSREYLHTLHQRVKWRQPQLNFQVGYLVLILDTSLLRQGRWPLGRITAVHPGADSQTRVATIKTSLGEYIRPVTKLCRLPV